jgi:diguanylate cyclase (GGDEF)-like protein
VWVLGTGGAGFGVAFAAQRNSATLPPSRPVPRERGAGSRILPERGFRGGASDTIFRHLDESNGLANPVVSAFAEDGDGFLWVGSQSGLQRWDGYRFWSYKTALGVDTSIPDNLVQALYTDPQGRLWIGTSSGGLARYDRARDSFIRYRLNPSDLNRVDIFSITADGVPGSGQSSGQSSGQGIWIGSDTGLDHLDTVAGTFTHVDLAPGQGPQPRARRVSAVLRSPDGTLWVGTDRGLERSVRLDLADLGKSVFVGVPLPVAKGGTGEVLSLFRDSAGRIWIGTPRGAFVIDRPEEVSSAAGTAEAVRGTGEGRELLPTQRYLSIAETSQGEIWLGTQDEGVLALTPATGKVRHIGHDPALPASIADDMVQGLYLGRSGIMWAGTRNGISYLDTTPMSVFTMVAGAGRGSVIRDSNVYSVLGRADGSVWLALSKQGVTILDASGRKAGEIRAAAGGKAADAAGGAVPVGGASVGKTGTVLPQGAVTGLTDAGDGSVYLCTQRGLFRARPAGGPAFGPIRLTQMLAGSEATRGVTRVLPDGDALWIGSSSGIWRLGPDGQVQRPPMQHPLTDQRVTVLYREAGGADNASLGGALWIGTQNGLNRLDLATGAVDALLPAPADPTALGGGYISSLLTDRKGRLWVGTFSGGIDVLEGRATDGTFRFHRILDGLLNENIDMLVEARDGKIWASTDGGLAVIDPETFGVEALGGAEGAVLPAYWNGSGAMTAGGELLFGGIGGVTVARPEMVKSWTYQPPVVVTNARVGDSEIPPSRFNSGVDAYPVWVPAGENNLTVGFTALDYTAPERNRYEYKLDGFDKEWISADATRRLARYTNLPPGEYLLELRGSNRDAVWAPTRKVRIRVLPAWFQTLWFRVFASLLVLVLLYGIILLVTAYLRRQQRELERQVARRTAELRQMTVELRESQQKLEHMAYTDSLTGLPNRRMFTEKFKSLIALKRRQEGYFSLMLMDFDDFKMINDTYGHDAGDAVLTEMSRRMTALVRESDCLARLGGDEFGLLLGESQDIEGTEMVCRKIIESFASPVLFEGLLLKTAPSIGIALYPFDGSTQDRLYKVADLALYRAKRSGGNGCCWSERVAAPAQVH